MLPAKKNHSKPPPQVNRILLLLFEASALSRENGFDIWQLAVDVDTLRETGASFACVQALALRGLITLAVEVTDPGRKLRRFKHKGGVVCTTRMCAVLTTQGARLMRNQGIQPEPTEGLQPNPQSPGVSPEAPGWDSRRRELRLGTVVLKHFRQKAESQELIMSSFQEQRWAFRIDDPLPPKEEMDRRRRLQMTIANLNRALKHIRFGGDGTGDGVCWRFVA
jgi:hypothetical protein